MGFICIGVCSLLLRRHNGTGGDVAQAHRTPQPEFPGSERQQGEETEEDLPVDGLGRGDYARRRFRRRCRQRETAASVFLTVELDLPGTGNER